MTPRPEQPNREPGPELVGAATAGTAFLDAPGIESEVVFESVERVLDGMPDGAILTVYADDPSVRVEAEDWCAHRHLELLAVITHEHHGTTLAIKRRG